MMVMMLVAGREYSSIHPRILEGDLLRGRPVRRGLGSIPGVYRRGFCRNQAVRTARAKDERHREESHGVAGAVGAAGAGAGRRFETVREAFNAAMAVMADSVESAPLKQSAPIIRSSKQKGMSCDKSTVFIVPLPFPSMYCSSL